MKVWNLIYTKIESDDCYNSVVRVDTFSSEEKARESLDRDYNEMVEEIENGGTVLDCVRKENNGNNAKIELGYEAQFDWEDDIPEVETQHSWRIAMQTIDHAKEN